MKIALIYDAIYPFVTGGGERRNWEIARVLAHRGHEVSLLGMQAWIGDPVLSREGVRIVGVCPPMALFTGSGRRSFLQPFVFARAVYQHLRRTTYDMVDCASFPYLSCLAVRAALGSRKPFVITWYEVRGLPGWVRYAGLAGLIAAGFERLTGKLTSHNAAISALTRNDAGRILGLPPVKVAILPCGVHAGRGTSSGERRAVQVLYVGRLVRHKRVDLLVEAFSRLVRDLPAARLRIIGTGHAEHDLKAQVLRLGMSDKVAFSGQVDESVLEAAYKESSVFVLPSQQEGFGMVLLEAMAHGVPVIAASAPRSAAREIVQSGRNGLLFESVQELESGLRKVLGDAAWAESLAEEGRRTAVGFDWEIIGRECESFYTGVIRACGGMG